MLQLILFVLAYMLVANPATYRTTRSVLGSWVATQDGLAKMGGLVLHALVLLAALMLLKRLRTRSNYALIGMDMSLDMGVKSQEVRHMMKPTGY